MISVTAPWASAWSVPVGSRAFLAGAVADLPDVRLVAVADSDPSRAADLATAAGARAVPRWEDLLTDPEVAVVAIMTPPSSHAAIARAALEAGRHVWCEKPLATDAAAAADVCRSRRAVGPRPGRRPRAALQPVAACAGSVAGLAARAAAAVRVRERRQRRGPRLRPLVLGRGHERGDPRRARGALLRRGPPAGRHPARGGAGDVGVARGRDRRPGQCHHPAPRRSARRLHARVLARAPLRTPADASRLRHRRGTRRRLDPGAGRPRRVDRRRRRRPRGRAAPAGRRALRRRRTPARPGRRHHGRGAAGRRTDDRGRPGQHPRRAAPRPRRADAGRARSQGAGLRRERPGRLRRPRPCVSRLAPRPSPAPARAGPPSSSPTRPAARRRTERPSTSNPGRQPPTDS